MARSGRKPGLTEELATRIALLVRRGAYRETACAAAGVSPRTLRQWLRRAGEGGPHSARYRKFADALDKAEAEAEMVTAAAILRAGQGDWRALAWILERRGPQRWSPKHAVDLKHDVAGTLSELLALGLSAGSGEPGDADDT
jgi:transposase-like protein